MNNQNHKGKLNKKTHKTIKTQEKQNHKYNQKKQL